MITLYSFLMVYLRFHKLVEILFAILNFMLVDDNSRGLCSRDTSLFIHSMSETNLTVSGELRDQLSPVLTSDASISISTSIRSLCASEDGRDISISISIRISKPCVLHA